MTPAPKRNQPSLVIRLALVGSVLIGLFYANQMLQKAVGQLEQLPVQGQSVASAEATAQADSQAEPTRRRSQVQKSMHPLLVESRQKEKALNQSALSADGSSLDAMFGRLQVQEELDAKAKKEAEDRERAEADRKKLEAEARKAEETAKRLANALPALGSPQEGAQGGAQAAPSPVPAPKPRDEFAELAMVVKVQAVMPNGAIVNGGFFKLGEPVDTLVYRNAKGEKRHPVLVQVQTAEVQLQEAGAERRIVARLRL